MVFSFCYKPLILLFVRLKCTTIHNSNDTKPFKRTDTIQKQKIKTKKKMVC